MEKRCKHILIVIGVLLVCALLFFAWLTFIVPQIRTKRIVSAAKNGEVGDTIHFGDYEWYILAKESNRVLIITTSAVGELTYNDEYEKVTWEQCDLREWLNNTFYNEFSSDEKRLIADTQLENKNNERYETYGGNATNDKIFLLSLEEANKYFSDDSERAIGKAWWLRSPGNYELCATFVYPDGKVSTSGCDVVCEGGGVRPALWLDVE